MSVSVGKDKVTTRKSKSTILTCRHFDHILTNSHIFDIVKSDNENQLNFGY